MAAFSKICVGKYLAGTEKRSNFVPLLAGDDQQGLLLWGRTSTVVGCFFFLYL